MKVKITYPMGEVVYDHQSDCHTTEHFINCRFGSSYDPAIKVEEVIEDEQLDQGGDQEPGSTAQGTGSAEGQENPEAEIEGSGEEAGQSGAAGETGGNAGETPVEETGSYLADSETEITGI